MFVQHDGVVTPHVELEALNGRHYAVGIVGLAKDAKDQGENRKLRINGSEPVVAAFVSINDKVRKFDQPVQSVRQIV